MADNWILVTGATSPIGNTIVSCLIKEGYGVVASGRDGAKLSRCSTPVGGGKIIPLCIDLNNVGSIEDTLKDFIVRNEIRISGFVHCAGVVTCLPLRSLRHTDFSTAMNVTVVAAALICKVLSSRMVNKDSLKSVVLISSVSSKFGVRGYTAYSAGKAALDGFMRSAAVEYMGKVRINSILPGAVAAHHSYADERNNADVPKAGIPEDIANVVLFLMSEHARWISGQQIVVDGGQSTDITQRE